VIAGLEDTLRAVIDTLRAERRVIGDVIAILERDVDDPGRRLASTWLMMAQAQLEGTEIGLTCYAEQLGLGP